MADRLTIYPLGGLGEIGMNCMVLECDGTMLLIDCGLQFPEDYLYGIDVVIPRFDFVLANKDKLAGIVLTHGHEDHIGALPWLMPYVDVPIYGSRFTLALVRKKLVEHGLDRHTTLVEVGPGERLEFGPLAVNCFPVCHSIVEGYALGLETPVGRLLHSGDFKIDRNPMNGVCTDMDAIRRFAEPGVLLMLSDSTNVERDGRALTEREIRRSLEEIFARATGRIIVTLFSSHMQRIQTVLDLAEATGRKVAVNGRSMVRNIEIAMDLGLLKASRKTYVPMEALPNLPDDQVVLLVTGSQGEPLSALARVASGEHRQLRVHQGDLVLMSSRFIPGNTRAITKLIDQLYRQGAEVLYERIHAIHASGHAHRDELREMLEAVRPKFFVPIHGEYRHLVKHRRLAVDTGVAPERAVILENGDPISLTADGGMRLEDKILADSILVDGKGVGDVGQSVLKERQLLGGEGMVIVVLITDMATGEIIIGPDISSKGFVFEQEYSHVLEDAKCIVLDIHENVPPDDISKLKERIRSSLRRFFRKVLGRDPVVVPLVMTI